MEGDANFTGDVDYGLTDNRYGRVLCYNLSERGVTVDHKGWETAITLVEALPIFVAQILVANLSYRVIYYLTRPLRLPPFVAQILSGLLFSPTLLGDNDFLIQNVFPHRFAMVLETFANLALIYNMFLLGLGMDLRMIRIKDSKPVVIAIVSLFMALMFGIPLYHLPGNGDPDKSMAGGLFWATALACTNFPDLVKILADLKLLRSDVGRTAMCAAIITDLCTWVLLIIGMATYSKTGIRRNGVWAYILVSTTVFILLCYFAIRHALAWAYTHTTKRGNVGDTHVWYTLAGVLVCSLITEACGSSSISGAFLFGLMIPQDHIIRNMIEEKLHYFLSGVLMPLFYVICGTRANLGNLFEITRAKVSATILFPASFLVKLVPTVICSRFLRMPLRDGFAIGALMNTKGTLALVVINAGRDIKALDVSTYTIMTLVLLVMAIVVQPVLSLTYSPKNKSVFYKNRTIQNLKGQIEFRVLTCVHVLANVSGITSLLQLSNPTNQSPLNVFAIHLVELTGHTKASLLIMNDEAKPKSNFSDRVRAESEQIAETFEAMEVNNEGMSVQTITAVSPYATMHEDISLLAEDKQASFILLPYHKTLTSDGRLDEGNAAHEEINTNVFSHAPCSVGILVDRGMTIVRSESSSFKGSSFKGSSFKSETTTTREIAMLFIGGRDDREALAYAWRMVGQEMVKLTVLRFVPSRKALLLAKISAVEYEKEKKVDEECIYEFNFKTMDDSSVTYIEKVVNDGQDAIAAIRELEDNNPYDLYIVGRGYKVESPVTTGLTDWSSIPDLGIIGDTLASSNFLMQASVLVVQQYSSANKRTANNNHQVVEGEGKTASEFKPFIKSHDEFEDEDDDEGEKYHMGLPK